MAELVYRQPCAECGSTGYLHEYDHPDSTSLITRSQCHVCGGSGRVERVLDPDKVLIHLEWASPRHGFSEKVSVADVLEALRLDDPIEEGCMSERLMILGSFQGADSPTVGPITVREAVVREPTLPDVVAWLKENADVKDTAATKRLNADGRFTWQVPDMDGPGRYLVVCLPDETP